MGLAIQQLKELKNKGSATLFPDTIKIMIGVASCGVAAGALLVMEAFRQGATKKRLAGYDYKNRLCRHVLSGTFG